MSATVAELIGVMASIVVLAGVSVAIINGGNTAKIIGSFGDAFSKSINAATHPGS